MKKQKRVIILCLVTTVVLLIGLSFIHYKPPQTQTSHINPTENSLPSREHEACPLCANGTHDTSRKHKPPKRQLTPQMQSDLDYLKALMNKDGENLEIVDRPDGGKRLVLNGSFQSVSAARVLPDGSKVVGCFDHYENLEDFLLSDSSKTTNHHHGNKENRASE